MMVCILFSATDCSEHQETLLTKKSTLQEKRTIVLSDAEWSVLPYLDSDFTFLEGEARKHAKDIAQEFTQVDGIRRSVGNPIIINLPRGNKLEGITKTDSTPELYIYNFSPKGFAVIAADERSLGHVASDISEHLDKQTTHPGYQIVLVGALDEVFRDRSTYRKKQDSVMRTTAYLSLKRKFDSVDALHRPASGLARNWLDKLVNWLSIPAYAQVRDYVGPYKGRASVFRGYVTQSIQNFISSSDDSTVLLRTCFGQKYPYNAKFRLPSPPCTRPEGRGRYVAGCVAVAYAQAMLYFNTPQVRSKALSACSGGNWDSLYQFYYGTNSANLMSFNYNDEKSFRKYPTVIETQAGLVYGAWDHWTRDMDVFGQWFNTDNWSYNCNYTSLPYFRDVAIGCRRDVVFNETMGFREARWRGYEFVLAKESLLMGSPLVMYGAQRSGGWICENWGWFCGEDIFSAHGWVVDGLIRRTTVYDIVTATYEERETVIYGEKVSQYRLVNIGQVPTGRSSSTIILSPELHNNWGSALQARNFANYKRSGWTRSGVFEASPSQKYVERVSCLPYIKRQ